MFKDLEGAQKMCTKPFLIARAQTWTTPKFTFAHSITAWAMPCPWPLPYMAEVPCKLPKSSQKAFQKLPESRRKLNSLQSPGFHGSWVCCVLWVEVSAGPTEPPRLGSGLLWAG